MPAYGYAPPPPPPSVSASASTSGGGQQPGYGRPSHGPFRGGGGGPSGRGRGGHYSNNSGRPEYGHPQPAQYEYAGQPYPGHHNPPYGASQPPAAGYAPSQHQWHPDQAHALPQPPHAPAPISPSNYHPNYTNQPHQPAQYPQQPPYSAPQQYGPPYPAQPPPPPQWSGQGHSPPPAYGNGGPQGGRNDRGGPKLSYGHEQQPPALGGYAAPYPADPRASYPPPQYHYGAPPPPPQPPSYHDGGHQGGHFGRGRGRGGGHRGAGGRGRGGVGPGPKSQNRHNNQDNRNAKNQQHSKKPQQQPENPNTGKKKKRKTNTLGLTPGMESESEDDDGEEKALEQLLGQETYKLNDIAQYLAERRKNFPTKARVEARQAAESAQKVDDEDSALLKERDKLRRQLAKVESSIKRKREPGDEGDEMRGLTINDSEEDDKPEVMSSRPSAGTEHPPPAKKADSTRHCKYFSTGGTCGKKSKCRFVHDPQVREAAIKEREANNGRLTIQQRLILNDKEQEDLAILESIQYLREKGLMKKDMAPAAGGAGDDDKPSEPTPVAASPASTPTPSARPPKTSLLPAASPSLPPPPPKREPVAPRREQPPPSIIPSRENVDNGGVKHYQGWLLEPYGSTQDKQSRSDDLP